MHFRQFLTVLLTGAVWATACTAPGELSGDGEGLNLSFALSVGRIVTPSTRMTDVVVQNTGESSFRGIEQIYAIPFRSTGLIEADDPRYGSNVVLPQRGLPANTFGVDAQGGAFPGLVWNNNAHLYTNVYFLKGTRSLLVYGKAIDDPVSVATDSVAFKSRNGSLRARGLEDGPDAKSIRFELDPIADVTALETELDGLLGYLNSIAQTSVTYEGEVVRWSEYAARGIEDALSSAFRSFTSERRPFAGSSRVLDKILADLYHSLYSLSQRTDLPGVMAAAVCDNINNDDFVTVSGLGTYATVTLHSRFPVRYGVPAGSVTLQWDGTQFWRPTRASGNRAISLSSFCYPPSLWYYTNSLLAVSEEENLVDEYVQSRRTWTDITDLYSSSSLVSGSVRSVAVRSPLQYGVALLNIMIKPVDHEWLLDSKYNRILVNGTMFPLTGVVVGDQRDLSFDFTPTGEEVHYTYDQEVYDGTTPKNYISNLMGGVIRKSVQVLATQTLPQEDLHLALEFQNNSGSDFYGHNGDLILDGNRFYLFAKLKLSSAVNNANGTIDCILMQDHVTAVTFRIDSLAEAYSTLPEMKDPTLQVGVDADLDWVLSTPFNQALK